MNQRAHLRHNFDFFVLEHRPEDGEHSQATRVLICKDFSKGGLRLEGVPRYDKFKATISSPHDDSKFEIDLEVAHQSKSWFGVKFISPSDALIEKLSWWDREPWFKVVMGDQVKTESYLKHGSGHAVPMLDDVFKKLK